MFFMMGITDGRKQLDFTQTVICGVCGKYGRYQVFMTYTVLSLFFIPCFKWNRHYYVQMSCCNTLYELDPEVGKGIARGEQVEILPQHLTLVNQGGVDTDTGAAVTAGMKRQKILSIARSAGNGF